MNVCVLHERDGPRSRRTVTFFPRSVVARSAATISSARDSGTSISENRSAISIAPRSLDAIPASPVMAPTRSPGRIPASRPAPMNSRTASSVESPRPRTGRCRGACFADWRRDGRDVAFRFVPRLGRVRQLHGGGRNVGEIELLRQRLDDHAHVVELPRQDPLPDGGSRHVQSPGLELGHGRHGGDVNLLLREGLDGAQQTMLARLDEHDGRAGAARASRAANAVDIRLRGRGHVVVDDV